MYQYMKWILFNLLPSIWPLRIIIIYISSISKLNSICRIFFCLLLGCFHCDTSSVISLCGNPAITFDTLVSSHFFLKAQIGNRRMKNERMNFTAKCIKKQLYEGIFFLFKLKTLSIHKHKIRLNVKPFWI